ncbi:hypothetical protein FGE12_08920 [Aggregicoccus sp. 17bor-14]|uniref:hypothetical protein n=1 Tax=Myxococcaceae TaxID=31 RepID=UPI00129CFC65|nr:MULTISPECIES: hypothetical protein [Myxococcaceae]MBF5042521.1 hypothetical protein [Simulacricoccus sp. 17bor-14]MRI88291.1 hypothetical protein [Aggregicoccus sp. 17bor-14]
MVNRLQEHLEAIYGFQCEARAEAFLVQDPALALALGGTGRSEEELLVGQGEDGLELALCFAPGLLARLEAYEGGPVQRLLERELDGYCQLAEGVSHFLYLARSAAHERRVSLLELEAQAEVDKFAVCLLHRWGDGVERWAEELLGRLFDRVRYREQLAPEERWRYQEANRVSRAYCRRLMGHVSARRLESLLRELRYAYRLGAGAKLDYFACGT